MSANGALHQPRRAWTPGGYALCTLQTLRATTDAVPDTALLAACNAAKLGAGRKRTMTHYRRDILHNLHDRGYIEPGPQPRTWRLRDAARAELAHISIGQRIDASLHEQAEPAAATLQAQLTAARQTAADELLRHDLRAAATGRGLSRPPMSAADRSPCVQRAGADEALQCPSRRGNRLYWRDGRVTSMDGSHVSNV